jgi:hypothetical protein
VLCDGLVRLGLTETSGDSCRASSALPITTAVKNILWVHLTKLRKDASASISGAGSLLAILGIGGVAAAW